MKKTIGIKRNFIIIIISILLSACTKKENASQQALLLELVQAEAVMYEHPDSALGVLQGMKVRLSGNFWLLSFKISYLCLPLFYETRTTPSCHPSGCAYRQL